MNPLSFIHLTDTHISQHGAQTDVLPTDTRQLLELVKGMIREISPTPSFIVISGDLCHDGEKGSVVELKRLLADINIPVLLALGNHDRRDTFYEVMLGRTTNLNEPYYYSQIIAGIHIIVLDSSIPGRIRGGIDPGQLVWLEKELTFHSDLPKLLVIHHPPDPWFSLQPLSATGLDTNAAATLGALIEGKRVIGVLSGHVHYDQVSLWHGVPCVTSTGFHSLKDVLALDEVRTLRGAAFNLCSVRQGQLTVVPVQLPGNRQELSRRPATEMRTLIIEHEAALEAAQLQPSEVKS